MKDDPSFFRENFSKSCKKLLAFKSEQNSVCAFYEILLISVMKLFLENYIKQEFLAFLMGKLIYRRQYESKCIKTRNRCLDLDKHVVFQRY